MQSSPFSASLLRTVCCFENKRGTDTVGFRENECDMLEWIKEGGFTGRKYNFSALLQHHGMRVRDRPITIQNTTTENDVETWDSLANRVAPQHIFCQRSKYFEAPHRRIFFMPMCKSKEVPNFGPDRKILLLQQRLFIVPTVSKMFHASPR